MILSFTAIWKCYFSDGRREQSPELLLFTTSGDQIFYENFINFTNFLYVSLNPNFVARPFL